MINLVVKKAKSGLDTCLIEGKPLHSLYDPQKEADNYVRSIECNYTPSCVIILDCALSYIAEGIKRKFPVAPLIAIRYSHIFDKYNKEFDKVLYYDKYKEDKIFIDALISSAGEGRLLNALILSWAPCEVLWKESSYKVWKLIKEAMENCKTCLVTNSFFMVRWLKNTLNTFNYLNKVASIGKLSYPVLITASGKSLEGSIPYIKKYRDKVILVALSSSCSVLLNNKITPDIVLTTDGGYYAKLHLLPLESKEDILLIAPASANISKKILENNTLILLNYNSGYVSALQKIFDKVVGINSISVNECATVSGVALNLFLSLTKENIYICGLDLAPNPQGSQHARPNILEINKEIMDNKLEGAEKRLVESVAKSEYPLKMYREWFTSFNKEVVKRVYRLSSNYKYSNSLGGIKDINFETFSSLCKSVKAKTCNITGEIKKISEKERVKIQESVKEFIKKNCENDKWYKEVFPLEYLQYERLPPGEEREAKLLLIKEKSDRLKDGLYRCFTRQ